MATLHDVAKLTDAGISPADVERAAMKAAQEVVDRGLENVRLLSSSLRLATNVKDLDLQLKRLDKAISALLSATAGAATDAHDGVINAYEALVEEDGNE